jgi:thiol-disulfide isomerase/thioredoxin
LRPLFRILAAADTLLLALVLSVLLTGDGTMPLRNVPGQPQAPDVTFATPEGARLRLSELRGRVVVVNFWASWCPPCRDEMPSLARFGELVRAEPVAIVAVNSGENAQVAARFWAALNPRPPFGFVLDRDGAAEGAFRITGLPTTVVIDPQGRIAYRAEGDLVFDNRVMLRTIRGLMVK